MSTKIYAGIGSRETPSEICELMTDLARQLSDHNWYLRSGHADRADQAFEAGADRQRREIYLPWPGFNGATGMGMGFIVPTITPMMLDIARRFHPAWDRCSQGAQKMHCRNVCQILGLDCNTPADMVVCWTPGGRGGGGTGQAIRIANGYKIPVFDLAIPGRLEDLVAFVNQREAA